MDEKPLPPEARSWTEAEAASTELPEQLRALRRMVAAAHSHLEQLSASPGEADADETRP